MRKLWAAILILTLAGCASARGATLGGQGATTTEECTRLEAALRVYAKIPIEIQEKAIEDCGRGDIRACVAVPVAIPYTLFVQVIAAPLLLPLFMLSPKVQRSGCPQPAGASSAGATDLPTQSSGTEPSGKGRAIPVSADEAELVELTMDAETLPALLRGRLRNRSTLVLTDVSIKVSFYDGQGKVGEGTVGGVADRLQGKTTVEKGITDMRILPGEARDFVVPLEVHVPAHYTRIEHQVLDAWGTPPAEPEAITGPAPPQP